MQKTTSPHSPASKPYAHPPTPSSKPSSSTATIQTYAKIASTYSPPPKTSSPTTATFENSNPTALYSRGYARIAHLGNTGFFLSPYFAFAQYGLLSRLFRIRSIRALVAPISHSLHTALGLRLCARAGALARIRLRCCAIASRQYAQLLSPYLARWAQYGLLSRLFRIRSIRRVGSGYVLGLAPLRAYAYAVALLPAGNTRNSCRPISPVAINLWK